MLPEQLRIQQLYQPVQPTVSAQDDEVVYQEYAPLPDLQPFVHCYWELQTQKPLENDFCYRVVADGCMDILLDVSQPAQSFAIGFATEYTEFPLPKSFHYRGIRFLPTAFPQLFQISAGELTNRFEPLELVLPTFALFLAAENNPQAAMRIWTDRLNLWLLHHLGKVELSTDRRVFKAIEHILLQQGTVNIEQLDTGVSPRQLRRLFQYYVGDSPKTFSKVVRFQKMLQAKPSVQSLRQNKVFFDHGYFDQAHFIKEFRHYFGDTPGKAFPS